MSKGMRMILWILNNQRNKKKRKKKKMTAKEGEDDAENESGTHCLFKRSFM